MILPSLRIQKNEVAREAIRVCSDAACLHLGITERYTQVMCIRIVPLPAGSRSGKFDANRTPSA
jgi:hypothetical protein